MKSNETGFTIIELLIATAIFTVILIITTTSIIGISQTYVKGSVENQTQQSARSILSSISQDIEFNNATNINISDFSSPASSDERYFCIGNDVYVFKINKYLSFSHTGSEYSNIGLIRYASNSCPTAATLPTSLSTMPQGYTELLANHERIGQLNIKQININNFHAYTISLEIGYGSNSLLGISSSSPYYNDSTIPSASTTIPYQCQSGLDSSFCAVSILTTTVAPRINNIRI